MHPSVSARLLGALALAAALAACDRNTTALEVFPEFDDTFSFESGMSGWTGRALELGDPAAAWEVARTQERATEGASSVRLSLANAAESRVWIERRYPVPPDQEYLIEIEFDLASADYAGDTPWSVLAGATPNAPQTAAELGSVQDTNNNAGTPGGHVWLDRSRTVIARSDEDGELFVYVGVWGRSAGTRSYDVDLVHLTFTRRGLSAPQL